eukprot:1154011-Pelagomonas_calceolata.AAC.2
MAAAFSEVGKTVQTTSYKSKLRNPSFIKRPTSDCPAVFLLSILTTCFRPCKAECEKMDALGVLQRCSSDTLTPAPKDQAGSACPSSERCKCTPYLHCP